MKIKGKQLSHLTRQDWIDWQWIETTEEGDRDRHFVRGYMRTPDEMAKAAGDWDRFRGD